MCVQRYTLCDYALKFSLSSTQGFDRPWSNLYLRHAVGLQSKAMMWRRLYRDTEDSSPACQDLDRFLMRVLIGCAFWTALETLFIMYVMSRELQLMEHQANRAFI